MKPRKSISSVLITEVEAIPFRIPYRRVHWQAIGALDAIENVLVRVKTEAGVVGVGEAVSTNKFNSNTLLGTALVIRDYLGPTIVGETAFKSQVYESG
jgi:L-alanine-DL-glutamate epimerase-like enolase superfamily enzyme